MTDRFWLTTARIRRITPGFPLSHGLPRVVRCILYVIHHGLC